MMLHSNFKKWFIRSMVVIILFIGITVTLSSCGEQNSIVGSWANSEGNIVYEFFKDGSCKARVDYISYYEVSESGTLTFYDEYHYPRSTYNFMVKGNKLYMSQDEINENSNYYIRK